jgi:hypothetical protein
MNPNHLEVLRVFTRRADELVEDTTINPTSPHLKIGEVLPSYFYVI